MFIPAKSRHGQNRFFKKAILLFTLVICGSIFTGISAFLYARSGPPIWAHRTLEDAHTLLDRVQDGYVDTSAIFDTNGGENFDYYSKLSKSRKPSLIQIASAPRIFYVRNMVSPAEADGLIAEAKLHLARSTTVHKDPTKRVNEARTSQGMFMSTVGQHLLADPIRNRISKTIGIPAANFEAMQVLRYSPGEFYKTHPDWFSGEFLKEQASRGGNRQATIITFLNTLENCGGTTRFPFLNVSVPPRQGDGVLFYSLDLNGNPNTGAMHTGDPPNVGCEKWVSVFWMRQGPFR